MKHLSLFVVIAALGACAVPSNDPDDFVLDRNAPRVAIESPARGTIAGDVTHVLVTGTASDDSGAVPSVTVNGVPATLAGDGTWTVQVPVEAGTTLLRAIALDDEGNRGEQTRAVVAGPMVPLDQHVERGIRSTLSAQALLVLGHGAETFIENGGLTAAAQAMNPVIAIGGGPDCFYGQASITSLTVGDADVLMGPTNDGIMVSAALDDVRVGMHLSWAVSCLEDSRDIEVAADRVTVQGLLVVGVAGRKLVVQFDDPTVDLTGFDPQLPEVPDSVIDMLRVDAAISPILGSVTERLVAPMVRGSVAALDETRTLDVAGTRLELAVEPTEVRFTPEGGTITFDTSWRAQADRGEFVYVPTFVPALEMNHGFELAVADDAANQLLTSMWSAGAFDTEIDLATSPYVQVAELYDTVELELMVPPHVDANGRPLALTFGDWIATFEREGVPQATVAIHATTDLYVTEADDRSLHLNVAVPAVRVDLVGEHDWISKGQYDAIKSFAIDHVTALGSAAVRALPLPAVGDTMPSLWVEPASGYLLVRGDVQ